MRWKYQRQVDQESSMRDKAIVFGAGEGKLVSARGQRDVFQGDSCQHERRLLVLNRLPLVAAAKL